VQIIERFDDNNIIIAVCLFVCFCSMTLSHDHHNASQKSVYRYWWFWINGYGRF